MDQELIAYFDEHFRGIDERFRETSRQISDLREETTRQFERIDSRFEQIDSRFEQIDSRFEQIDSRFEQIDSHFERVEETARQTVVLVEGLRHEVHLIAEAFLEVGPKLELYHNESKLSIDDVKRWMEKPFRDLDNRIHYLEVPKERQFEDVMDEVRRVLGKPPRQTPPVASD
jgi:archaellum component FlaC